MLEALIAFSKSTGFAGITGGTLIMLAVACTLLYLAIVKKFEPLLLVPIAFGVLLTNLPFANMMMPPVLEVKENLIHTVEPGGLLYYLFQGDHLGIFPPLIFCDFENDIDFTPDFQILPLNLLHNGCGHLNLL